MVVADHLGPGAVLPADGVVDQLVLDLRIMLRLTEEEFSALLDHGLDVPAGLCDESVQAALVLPVDEELVDALHVVFSFSGDDEAEHGSAEVLVLGLGEVFLELGE